MFEQQSCDGAIPCFLLHLAQWKKLLARDFKYSWNSNLDSDIIIYIITKSYK
jgi:hypothetical protein